MLLISAEMEHLAFNGDGDGLCALQQLVLEGCVPGSLTSGVKRDIALVKRVEAQPGDTVTVLDVSLSTNVHAVRRLLDAGVKVRYFDHHHAGTIEPHQLFEAHIDISPAVCTSLIVNAHLGGKRRLWAAVGAWADNLEAAAIAAVEADALPADTLDTLRELGNCLNYNAYGDSEGDLLIAPLDLHRRLIEYSDPREFCRRDSLFGELRGRLAADIAQAESVRALESHAMAAVFLFPDVAWARRVSGSWAHRLANRYPQRAHAVLTVKPGGGYVASVRAPKSHPKGAVDLCRKFPSGGGRESAAGINYLAEEQLVEFCEAFLGQFGVER